jgi:4-amino-4-deoxy-L-arabinose transferase-like glycosyltransferase
MKKTVIVLIFIFLFFRVLFSLKLQLHPDESYYWLWSKHLDLSYFDHPPMVAYFIKLTTLFSSSEFFVRLSTIFSYVIFNIVLYLFCKKFFADEIAWLTLLVFNSFPSNALGFIITPDIPLMLFTVLFLYFLFSAIEEDKPVLWYVTGIFCGLALLSKYNAILLLFSIFIFALLYRISTRWLIIPIVSFVLFLPVIIWNYNNNFVSFKYQLFHGIPETHGSLNNIITYFGGQIISLGVFLGLFCFYVLFKNLFVNNKKIRFLTIFALVPILFFAITSFKTPAEMNWPLCGYPTLAILVSQYSINKEKIKKYFLYPSITFSLVLIFIVYLHGCFRIIPLEKLNPTWTLTDPTNWFYGWKEFAKFLTTQKLEYPIVTTNHQLASELIYYSNSQLNVYYNEKQFCIFNKNKEFPKQFYFINYESDVKTHSAEEKGFKYRFVQKYDVFRKSFRIRTYNIYFCEL